MNKVKYPTPVDWILSTRVKSSGWQVLKLANNNRERYDQYGASPDEVKKLIPILSELVEAFIEEIRENEML